MATSQSSDIVKSRHRFDPAKYSISAKTFLALLTDGKHIRDHFSDLYIGIAVFATRIKFRGWLKLHACLLTIPLNEDMKLRSASYVVQWGQPFTLPDGLVWADSGYVFCGGNPDMPTSPLDTIEKIQSHELYDSWFNSLFLGITDKIDDPPKPNEYVSGSLVQPKANFNNIVAYHDANPNNSCTDGLCDVPSDDDEVSKAYQVPNRPNHRVAAFWTPTARSSRADESSKKGTPAKKSGDKAKAKIEPEIPVFKLPQQRLPDEILDKMDRYDCPCGKNKTGRGKTQVDLWVQCDFCGRREHRACVEADRVVKSVFACSDCILDDQVGELERNLPMPAETGLDAESESRAEVHPGASNFGGPASEIDQVTDPEVNVATPKRRNTKGKGKGKGKGKPGTPKGPVSGGKQKLATGRKKTAATTKYANAGEDTETEATPSKRLKLVVVNRDAMASAGPSSAQASLSSHEQATSRTPAPDSPRGSPPYAPTP